MLGDINNEQEIKVLKSLAYKVKNNDSYFKPFRGIDMFGMPLVMSQDEYLIRTLIDVYNVTSYNDILEKIKLLELNNECEAGIKGSLTIFLKIGNKKKVSYTKMELEDIIKFPNEEFYKRLKQQVKDAVKVEFKLKGDIFIEIVSEAEYNQNIKGTSYVRYELGEKNSKVKGKNK